MTARQQTIALGACAILAGRGVMAPLTDLECVNAIVLAEHVVELTEKLDAVPPSVKRELITRKSEAQPKPRRKPKCAVS